MSDSNLDYEMQHNLILPHTEDAVDELLLSGSHNGTITEFEKPNWFAAHRNGWVPQHDPTPGGNRQHG